MSMSITEKNTLEIRTQLMPLIGEVTAKPLFTGYGLYYQKHMFGMCQQDIFYLRAKDKLALFLERHGAVAWESIDNRKRSTISNYYQLPKQITQNALLYQKVIRQSIRQIEEEKLAKKLEKLNQIKQLPNLSIKYERLLAKVEIYDVKTFKTVGAINAYVRLKKLGISVNLETFWSLYASLQDRNAKTLTDKEKRVALSALNIALANAGLRQIKGENLL